MLVLLTALVLPIVVGLELIMALDLQNLIQVVIAFAVDSSSSTIASKSHFPSKVHPYSCFTSSFTLGTCPLVIAAVASWGSTTSSSIVDAFVHREDLHTFAVDDRKVGLHHIVLLDSSDLASDLSFDFHTFATFNSDSCLDYFGYHHHSNRR